MPKFQLGYNLGSRSGFKSVRHNLGAIVHTNFNTVSYWWFSNLFWRVLWKRASTASFWFSKMSGLNYTKDIDKYQHRLCSDQSPSTELRNVYINPNVSKAESKAAYEERCRRRLAVHHRGELCNSSGPSIDRQVGSPINYHISHDNVSGVSTPEAAATSRPILNPTASEFTAVTGSLDTQTGMWLSDHQQDKYQ